MHDPAGFKECGRFDLLVLVPILFEHARVGGLELLKASFAFEHNLQLREIPVIGVAKAL